MLEVFGVFLRLGSTSFGGPIAHLAIFRRTFVERRGWLDAASFARIVALCSVLPGPTSSQVGMLVGLRRAGPTGALAAWLGFTLPSALVLGGFGLAVAGLGAHGTPPLVAGAFTAMGAAVIGVIANATYALARALVRDVPSAAVAAVAAGIAAATGGGRLQWLPIVAGAALGAPLLRREIASDTADGAASPRVSPALARSGILVFAVCVIVAVVPLHDPVARFLATIVRAGSLVFGGGHVVVPLLQTLAADGLVAERDFLAGYAAAQAVPGPLFAVAAFLGAANASALHGIPGAVVATVLIFAPSFALLFAIAPVWEALHATPGVRAALRGASAAVVGLLAATTVNLAIPLAARQPLLTAAVAGATALALASGRVPPWIPVVTAALAGAAWVRP